MTAFSIGQITIARQTAQGLVRGETYRVRGATERPTPFGNFVTYEVESGGGNRLAIANGHLLLAPVPSKENLL